MTSSPTAYRRVTGSGGQGFLSIAFLLCGFLLGVLVMQWTDPIQLSRTAKLLMEQVHNKYPSYSSLSNISSTYAYKFSNLSLSSSIPSLSSSFPNMSSTLHLPPFPVNSYQDNLKPAAAEKEPQPVSVPEALPKVPVKSDKDSKATSDAPVVKTETKAVEKDTETETDLETPLKVTHVVTAWKSSKETCDKWISTQHSSGSYLDAYVIGSQKGATSQLSKHLHFLGVRPKGMSKEWHFYNTLSSDGDLIKGRTVGEPIPKVDLPRFRLMHYKTGFRTSTVSAPPVIDNRPINERALVVDMTVEYLHSDRSAMLAKQLTPYSKVIVTIRDPMYRALSQYNMVVRNYNSKRKALNISTEPSTAEYFDAKVRAEVDRLQECGYDAKTASYTSGETTMGLMTCMLNATVRASGFDDMLYITRGLYHLHIGAWFKHFPAHRVLVLNFKDISLGKRKVYNDLTDFLCIRPFPENLLKRFEDEGSELSFGQQAAKKGLDQNGFDSFVGDDRYLDEMWDSTKQFLADFYKPADEKLKQLVGEHFVYWWE